MAFETPSVVQARLYELDGQTGTIVVSPSSAFTSGSTVVVIGTAVQSGTGLAVRLSSVSGGGTWQSAINVRPDTDYAPNCFAGVLYNAPGSSPSITLTMNQSTDVRASFALVEIDGVPSSSVLDGSARTGTSGSSATSTATSATGTLTQSDNLILLCAGGWLGTPLTPSGYTNVVTPTANGSGPGYVGNGVFYKTVTSTSTQTGTVLHDASAGSSAILLVLKAASTTSLKYRFTFNSSLFTSADTGIEGYVWRNGGADSVLAEHHTGLAGDATAGRLDITPSASGVLVSDTIMGVFWNGTDTSGLITGTVV